MRHVSAFSTAPMTPALCGRRHFLPFWSARAGMQVAGPRSALGVEGSEAQAALLVEVPEA